MKKYLMHDSPIRPGSFKKGLTWGLVIAAVIFGSFVYYYFEHTQDDVSPASPGMTAANKPGMNLSKDAPGKNESANALLFLNTHGKMHKNLLGKKIIKGTITNLSVAQGYKDLQIAVIFLSANDTVLQTQQYFVNEPVKANCSISFRSVFSAPEETAAFRLKVVSATPFQ